MVQLPRMQRRTLLKLGIGAAAVFAVAGGGGLFQPGLRGGHLTGAREVMYAVARAVLDGIPLPSVLERAGAARRPIA